MVVVGSTAPALALAALLARREFRVVVLRHGVLPATYEHEGIQFRRRVSPLVEVDTPALQRVLSELSLGPVLRRGLKPLDPLFQVVLPRHRVDVFPGAERLLAELRREFPAVERPVEDLYRALGPVMEGLDKVFGADALWPPEGFFERRETRRAAALLGREGASADPFGGFTADHPFRTFVEAQVRFGGALDPDRMTPLGRSRLHGNALRASFLSDPEHLRRTLEEKVVQLGGEVRPRDSVERVLVERARVTGVLLSGLGEVLGARFVVSGLEPQGLDGLVELPTQDGVRPRYYRYVLNAVVRAEAVPVAMGSRVYLVGDPRRPLCDENLLQVESAPPDAEGRVVLTACALLPRAAAEEGGAYLRRVRGRVLRALEALVPFLERHLLVVDSPHDGRALEDRVKGAEVTLPSRWGGHAEPMESVDTHDDPGLLGVCGVPCRTPVENLLRVHRQVVPGLGPEGEYLNALGVARIITRSDRTRERLRRESWGRPEELFRSGDR